MLGKVSLALADRHYMYFRNGATKLQMVMFSLSRTGNALDLELEIHVHIYPSLPSRCFPFAR